MHLAFYKNLLNAFLFCKILSKAFSLLQEFIKCIFLLAIFYDMHLSFSWFYQMQLAFYKNLSNVFSLLQEFIKSI